MKPMNEEALLVWYADNASSRIIGVDVGANFVDKFRR
jgi:hypothetical protein